jgi:hypothetical protein
MAVGNESVRDLADWFVREMRAITNKEIGDQCELLLCASDLGIDTPRLRRVLTGMTEAEPDVSIQDQRLLDSVRRQLVFFRYGCFLDSRERFLDHWFNQQRYRGKDLFSVSLFVNLALEQQELLTSVSREYARTWYLRHRDIRALRVRAWAPHCLNLAGFQREAKTRAEQVIDCRLPDGSWDHDVRRTLGTVYPLLMSGHVPPQSLSASIDYAVVRIARGFADDLAIKAAALKSLFRYGAVDQDSVEAVRKRIRLQGGVFLSHNSTDKPLVRTLADDLRSAGVRVWIDEAEIRPGDSLLTRIEAGIAEMECLAVILSSRSVKSSWVQKELDMALVSSLSDRSIRVVPLLFEDCAVPLKLRDLRWVDFRSNYQQAIAEFLRALD